MAYNRIGTPKFYIDAVLLARKLGHIETEDSHGMFYLNPTITRHFDMLAGGRQDFQIMFNTRHFCNSMTDVFVLGHTLNTYMLSGTMRDDDNNQVLDIVSGGSFFTSNGWTKFPLIQHENINAKELNISLRNLTDDDANNLMCNEFSFCWSYEMPHTPDLELTQTFANESLKVQTTKGGHTLTNTGWTQPPKWGHFPQWKRGSSQVAYPARRSWNLKFSYLSDSDMMPQYYNEHDVNNNNRGIFERTSVTIDDPTTFDIDESSQSFNIKDNFLSKVMPTINLGLPFIFQPNKDVQEYAICRVNANSVSLNQVAHSVYDISLDIVETW